MLFRSTVAGGEQFDRVWLFTDEQCSPSFDNGWDGRKFLAPTGSVLQLHATQAEDNYQIHATNNINGTHLIVNPLAGQQVYTLHFRHSNTETAYEQLLLFDIQSGTVSDITTDGSTYTFIAREGNASNRFKLITAPLEAGDEKDKIGRAHV